MSTLLEDSPEAEITIATVPEFAEPSDSGPRCGKCGQPTDAAACPYCGWYPSLGIHVDIDAAFESVMTGKPPSQAGEEAAAPLPAWLKHLAVWKSLIPGWAWLMVGTTLVAVGAGVATRIVTLGSPTLQTYCGVGGLVGGIAVLVVAHVVSFLFCSFDDPSFGVADVIIKPLKIWKKLASNLPDKLWLANTGNIGLSVALCSALIVGGIPYEKLLDWGFTRRAKPNFLAAVADQAARSKGSGSKSLEGAVKDLASKSEDLNSDGKPLPPKPVVRQNLDCLIIGYQASRDGQLISLLLASDANGKLKYIGRVQPELDDDEAGELVQRFEKNLSTRPFVRTSDSGTWVNPRFPCRVTYTEWPQGSRPKNLEWVELMGEIKLPW